MPMFKKKKPFEKPGKLGKPLGLRFKKSCELCKQEDPGIDYKNIDLLRRYINVKGKFVSRRSSGNCAKHQRKLAVAIKRARFLALLSYIEK